MPAAPLEQHVVGYRPDSYGSSAAKSLGRFRAGFVVLGVAVRIVTPFNGAGPGLEIGTDADPDAFVTAADLNEAAAGLYGGSGAGLGGLFGSATEIKANYTAGAGTTAGAARVIVTGYQVER